MSTVTVNTTLKVDYPPSLRWAVEVATPILADILCGPPDPTAAEWDRVVDDHGRDLLVLRLTDFAGAATGVFGPDELNDRLRFSMALRGVMSRLLGTRLKVLADRIAGDIGTGEAA